VYTRVGRRVGTRTLHGLVEEAPRGRAREES